MELCVMGVTYVLAYGAGLWGLGVLTPGERLTVKRWLARFVAAERTERARGR